MYICLYKINSKVRWCTNSLGTAFKVSCYRFESSKWIFSTIFTWILDLCKLNAYLSAKEIKGGLHVVFDTLSNLVCIIILYNQNNTVKLILNFDRIVFYIFICKSVYIKIIYFLNITKINCTYYQCQYCCLLIKKVNFIQLACQL